ncbi:MAG: transposase, partial [Verrucomicrobiae bacterium]|nr:transposase [Verrucomicrobiae bacterium]
FGDYLVFHPHLHVLAATGLYDREGIFHELPVEGIEPLAELFRHRFLAVLRAEKLISEKKLRQLLAWKHSGFSLDAGTRPVRTAVGRQKLAEYLLRAPFSLEKITWVEKTKRVIYRSRTSWRTKRNFQVFTAIDFLAAAVEHIPPKNQHTIRYYGRYSNKSRGLEVRPWKPSVDPAAPHTVPAPPKRSTRNLRLLWRDLILRVWRTDPLICPCCKGLMRPKNRLQRPEEIQFFLQLHGLWEGIIDIPPPPEPPYDIEKRRRLVGVLDGGGAGARRVSPRAERANQTMEPLSCPFERLLDRRRAAAGRASFADRASQAEWQAPELPLDDERILVLDADPAPPDEFREF